MVPSPLALRFATPRLPSLQVGLCFGFFGVEKVVEGIARDPDRSVAQAS
jgi:hypothetical protein